VVNKAKALLKSKSNSAAQADEMREAALAIWDKADRFCRRDPVLERLFARVE
jgi:hypothetical protein